MQRIERHRHRADLAEAKTASGSTSFRAEMAEIAQEWRDLAKEVEAEASNVGVRASEGKRLSCGVSARGGLGRWPGGFVVGLVVGALGALTLVAPRWVEASTGFDIDRGSGALEWASTAILPLAGIAAVLTMRVRPKRSS
jgi:hypothetical protein